MKETSIIQIGDRILIDDVEWKVAEIQDGEVTLYHEGVGGMSHTIRKKITEIKALFTPTE